MYFVRCQGQGDDYDLLNIIKDSHSRGKNASKLKLQLRVIASLQGRSQQRERHDLSIGESEKKHSRLFPLFYHLSPFLYQHSHWAMSLQFSTSTTLSLEYRRDTIKGYKECVFLLKSYYGVYPTVLKVYSYLCAQDLLLEVLESKWYQDLFFFFLGGELTLFQVRKEYL